MTGGGPGYLQLIGSRRLSTELGDLVEQVNREGRHGFQFDYTYDADGHPANYYCRSDHYMYARFGIPIAFFTTGGTGLPPGHRRAAVHRLREDGAGGRLVEASALRWRTSITGGGGQAEAGSRGAV